jgi:hypothetical protein
MLLTQSSQMMPKLFKLSDRNANNADNFMLRSASKDTAHLVSKHLILKFKVKKWRSNQKMRIKKIKLMNQIVTTAIENLVF